MRKTDCPQWGETLYEEKHQSGLWVYTLPKPGYSKSYALFATRFGSADAAFIDPKTGERVELPDGIAHFLEHKMFEQPDGQNVFDRFAETGANANAFTSFHMTGYLFSCTRAFYQNLAILLDYVQTPWFTDENVQKEQGIIGQEIRMYQDDPNWRSYFNVIEAMYQKNPINRDIAGSIKSIATITKERLYQCYHTFYHPSNMVLFCVGDVEHTKVMQTVEEMLSDSFREIGPIQRIPFEEPPQVAKPLVEQSLSVSLPLFYLGFKNNRPVKDGADLLRRELTMDLLLETVAGKSSPLYQTLYEEGYVTNQFGCESTFELTHSYVLFGGEAPDPEAAIDVLRRELAALLPNGPDRKAVERARRVMQGDAVRLFNSVDSIAQEFTEYLNRGILLFDKPQVLEQITYEEVCDALRELLEQDVQAVSIVRR